MSAELQVRGLSVSYGKVEALHGASVQVAEGSIATVIGPNGAGKSTLLGAIMGLLASRGSVRYAGTLLDGTPAEDRVALGMCLVPERRELFAELPVEDNLRLGAYRRGGADAQSSLERVYALFPALVERRRDPAGGLSGGQQQMLALGRALMAKPRLLLLDEPSMGLAPRLVAEIFACIERLRAADTAILLVEQNATAALAIAGRGYVLEAGRVTLSGTGAELLADPAVRSAYLGI